ncbi:MAG: TraR/DksA C4-type zinc finger protein [Rhodocyclaceae bacterium]
MRHTSSETTFRQRIVAELAQMEAAQVEAVAAAGTVVLDQASVGRVSRMDALQQQAMAQGILERIKQRQRQLQAALSRLDAGSFGECCQCGSEIEPERLAADAGSVFCIDCETERSAKSRG